MITQSEIRKLFDYLPNGTLIHKTTRRGGKQKGSVAGSPHNAGYLQITIDGNKYLIHRLVWLWHFGKFPKQLDHINRIRSDNRIENLRECSYSQNHGNRSLQSNNTSGAKGVFLDKRDNVWMVSVAGEYIGRFKSKSDAIKSYDEKAKEIFSEFALTNSQLGVL
jgi:hypothetical protein